MNPRIGDNGGKMNQLLLRPALSLKLNRFVTAHSGYAYVVTYQPKTFYENRLWQQLALSNRLLRGSLLNRTRLEERYIQNIDGVGMRLRHMVWLRHPVGIRDLYLSIYDELFVNLNTLPKGPASGIDQNRLFVGIGKRLMKRANVRAEFGYMHQYINKTEVDDEGNHVLLLGLFGDF